MPRFLKILLAFLAGLIAGGVIPTVWYNVPTNCFGLFDQDGGGATGAIFILGLTPAIAVGTVVAIVSANGRNSLKMP